MRRLWALLLLCLLPGCNDVLGIGPPTPREATGTGGESTEGGGGAGGSQPTGGTPAAGGAGGDMLTTTAGGGGGGGGAGGGGAGGGEPQLPCDPGFAFSANPITTSQVVALFTGPEPWVYVALEVSGPAATDVDSFQVVGNGPYTWSWTVDVYGSGILTFTFVKNKNGGNPGEFVAQCQVEASL